MPSAFYICKKCWRLLHSGIDKTSTKTRVHWRCSCSGLFIGFEFVKNQITLEPDTELAQKVKNELRENFILVSTDGPFDNVIKSKPPLCFSKVNVDEVIGNLEWILRN